MSHFSVLVITRSGSTGAIEDALEPFWELDLSHEDMQYDDRAEWVIDTLKKDVAKFRKDSLLKYYNKPEDKEKREKYEAMTLDKFMREYTGMHKDDDGNWGYYHNPNAKWDWYQIGGRWSYHLKAKKGKKGLLGEPSWALEDKKPPEGYYDILQKKDIDFEGMRKDSVIDAMNYYDEKIVPLLNDPDKEGILGFMHGLEKVGKRWQTKEEYANDRDNICTFAVLYHGEWIERGKMGWWACVTDKKDKDVWIDEWETIVNKADPKDYFAVVDCHI